MLQLDITWGGRPTRGIAALNAPRWGGTSLGVDRVYFGRGFIWNVNATLRLRRGDAVLFERNYPAEAWKETYINNTDLPIYRTNQRILEDLKTGLQPPLVPPASKKKKKN